MDKFNVISITNDINELESDMQQWSLLPYDFRRRSNDDCIRMYGVTVPELYTRLKNNIQSIADLNKKDDSNLVYENAWEELDNYHWLLGISKQLQENPYIIIIDPNITDSKELDAKFTSYLSLNKRLRKISDNYSWQLWGYNVRNMHKLLKNIISDDIDKDKFVDGFSNIVKLTEDAIEPVYDYYNNAELHKNVLEMDSYRSGIINIMENSDMISKVITFKYLCQVDIDESTYDKLILPNYSPWFTSSEMTSLGINCTVTKNTNYYKAVIEALDRYEEDNSEDNKKAVLELGWNPSLKFNLNTMKHAEERQLKELSKYKYYDVSNFVLENAESKETSDIAEAFLVFGNNKKVALSLDRDMNDLYVFDNGEDGSFNKFIKVSRGSENFTDEDMEIYVFFLDNFSKVRLTEALVNTDITNYPNMNTILSYLTNARNDCDPDMKILGYAYYIDLVLKLINLDNNSGILSDYSNLAYKRAIYKVKSIGDKFSVDRLNNIIDIITSNVNLKAVLKNNVLIEAVLASPIIKKA